MNLIQDALPWTIKHLSQFDRKDLLMLFEVDQSVKQDQIIPITHLMVLIYAKSRLTKSLNTYQQRFNLVDWYLSIGKTSFAIDRLVELLHANLQSNLNLEVSNKEPGINIIGYARSLTGLGEDVRNITSVVEKLDIPFCSLCLRHNSDSILHLLVPNEVYFPKFATSIFCMNIIEYQKFVNQYDSMDAFGHIILQAPWELPHLPKEFIDNVSGVNEFWAISSFVKKALVEAGLGCIHHVHPAVNCDTIESNAEPIGQNGPFTFLYIFDAGSYLSRKNPIGLIEAFQNAFYNNEYVQLVLKVSNESNSDHYLRLKSACDADNRIKLINCQFDKSQLSNLYASADCYISLHRSEGFGRTIAEAALHKLPIIATSWSGSEDILPDDSELLVSYKLIPLAETDYPYSQDQFWAEPNLNHASELMLKVFKMSDGERRNLGDENYNFVSSHFSCEHAEQQIFSLLSSKFSSIKVIDN
ncbi:glycosyltransferase [Paraglaciecola sp. 2405UD69-4]|uniref:glycosyltransferase n=1 Tax=Paraglaciecola sp. 2405UD69-4 TaxID=3391836 RepID=UPI0039C8FC04